MGDFKVLLVDDERVWHEILKKSLEPEGLLLICTCYGEEAIRLVREDSERQIKALLLDWILWDPDNPEVLQEVPGEEVLREVSALRPDVPIFALTGVAEREAESLAEASEVGAKMMREHPEFRDYFAKDLKGMRLVREPQEVARIVKAAVKEVELALAGIPETWDREYADEYIRLRTRGDWDEIEGRIRDRAERDIERYRRGQIERTLGRVYNIRKRGKLIMENVLVARRIVIGSLWELGGNYFKLEQRFRYLREDDFPYCPYCGGSVDVDEMVCRECEKEVTPRVTTEAFKGYYFTSLGLTVGAVSGRDLLPEEEEWVEEYSRRSRSG